MKIVGQTLVEWLGHQLERWILLIEVSILVTVGSRRYRPKPGQDFLLPISLQPQVPYRGVLEPLILVLLQEHHFRLQSNLKKINNLLPVS